MVVRALGVTRGPPHGVLLDSGRLVDAPDVAARVTPCAGSIHRCEGAFHLYGARESASDYASGSRCDHRQRRSLPCRSHPRRAPATALARSEVLTLAAR